ncbi:hypothetical protein [Acetobacterium sp.]|uniref:hypothetical protein n=1 Tax=Acetobacterium sp. TaxID=1872094 RepID=UPI00271ED0EF|nr:hypothetical protein [Acetobacterium sp.]MDO9491439.1 hypothetical protein [Acetobacterium sp.]
MFVAIAAALAWAHCPANYETVSVVPVHFPEGSAALSADARTEVAVLLGAVAGNPMAEVEAVAYFPYGDRLEDQSAVLGQTRTAAIRNFAVSLGVDPSLIGSDIRAFKDEGQGPAYTAQRWQTVKLDVRVKADCHPLAALARETNPYR